MKGVATRRKVLAWLALAVAVLPAAGCAGFPRTGEGMARVDRPVRAFMQRWNVPGLALAVAVDGRLVLARGYGHADPATREPVRPASLFRVASASKPVTAVAVMQLVESGLLDLDDPVFGSILRGYRRRCPQPVDPALAAVTVGHFLTHASGWDTGSGADPMFNAALIARHYRDEGLTPVEAVIQDRVCRPLEFTPGTRQVYENLNYAALGRVVEAVSGMPYERYVRDRVFAPLGITAPRIGAGPRPGRLPGEVTYVARGGDRRLVPDAVGRGRRVPLQYGGFLLSAMDSHGGWVASAIDLVRFLAGVDGRPGVADLLDAATRERMGADPGLPNQGLPADVWYGMGWYRTRAGAWFHDGSLPGSVSYVRMEPDGVVYAALANTRHTNPAFASDFRDSVRRAVDSGAPWPGRDLFGAHGFPPAR